ncbi:MAG: mandelate racemase/muconate lactonizing enzyme family protein [Beijerinckiaceae bacterium]
MAGRIERVDLFPVRLPYARTMTWASSSESAADFMVLRLTTSDGVAGVSEGVVKTAWTGATLRTLAVAFEEIFIPMLTGLDPDDEAALGRIAKVRENNLAKAMIDVAVWDLRAARAGVPLWRLWGGRRDVDLSWCVTRQPPLEMAREAEAAVRNHGFRALKVKGGQGADTDIAALREIRRAVGDLLIYVDCNRAYPVDEAPDYVARLAGEGVALAEDPCPLSPGRSFGELKAKCGLPLLVDGDCRDLASARIFLESGAVALNLKIQKARGFTENRQIAAAAHDAGASADVGLFGESSLGSLAALQLAASLPSAALPAEVSGFLQFRDEYVCEPLRIMNGAIALPDTPGFAAFVDWKKVESLHP